MQKPHAYVHAFLSVPRDASSAINSSFVAFRHAAFSRPIGPTGRDERSAPTKGPYPPRASSKRPRSRAADRERFAESDAEGAFRSDIEAGDGMTVQVTVLKRRTRSLAPRRIRYMMQNDGLKASRLTRDARRIEPLLRGSLRPDNALRSSSSSRTDGISDKQTLWYPLQRGGGEKEGSRDKACREESERYLHAFSLEIFNRLYLDRVAGTVAHSVTAQMMSQDANSRFAFALSPSLSLSLFLTFLHAPRVFSLSHR